MFEVALSRPLWKIKRWHYCLHYDGMVKRARCSAGVPFASVKAFVPLPGGYFESRYPCCPEWGGLTIAARGRSRGLDVRAGMSTPTNCLQCPEHHVHGGVMSYATYLYCRCDVLAGVVESWRSKERRRVRPPEWCPRRESRRGDDATYC